MVLCRASHRAPPLPPLALYNLHTSIRYSLVRFAGRFCALKLCTTSSLAVTIVLVAYKICGFVPLWYLGIKTNKADRCPIHNYMA